MEINKITLFVEYVNIKPGGLDLSRRGLDRDSRSRRPKSISLDVMDNLDGDG